MNKLLRSTSETPRRPALILAFLGSMNLAVTLLVALSIAAIIGTVLQQDKPYNDYIIKFGPFWFEVFNTLGLYSVYSSLWFLLILFFLVLSTSTCIYKNTPFMLREMREYRQDVQLQTLEKQALSATIELQKGTLGIDAVVQRVLTHHGFKIRVKKGEGYQLVSAMKGSLSRLGYVLTHLAIVLICVGGLLDGNAILKARELMGQLAPETRSLPVDEVPSISHLGVNNPAFRGNTSIPEGKESNVLFINYKDGYLVQKLPFSIEVKDFRIEHYESGQPKSFESDLLIHDSRLHQPLAKTISVNHPLIYEGYSIYQASFSDGGSELNFKVWPLTGLKTQTSSLEIKVDEHLQWKKDWTLEVSDFRLFNINPSEKPGKMFENVGPSVQFKIRGKTGEAKEYINYMLPVEREGAQFYISGVRSTPAEDFRYLYVPVDDAGSLDRFTQMVSALRDESYLRKLALQKTSGGMALPSKEAAQLTEAMVRLAKVFVAKGMDGIISQIKLTVPVDKQEEVTQVYVQVLQQVLADVYVDVLTKEGVDVSLGLDTVKAEFFDTATTAIGALGRYGSPVFLQLENFKHHQATGLQITKSPGKALVYPGCAMLIIGIFLMFYAPQQRFWAWLQSSKQGQKLVLAAYTEKNKIDFTKKFHQINSQLEHVLSAEVRR